MSHGIPADKSEPINLEFLRTRSAKCIINSKAKIIGERMLHIKKDPLSSETKKDGKLYNTQEAFFKTQISQSKVAYAKSPKVSFIDMHLKAKSIVPGVGSYF